MYSLNNIPMDNPAFGWELLASSNIVSSYKARSIDMEIPGRHGNPSFPPAGIEAPPAMLVVRTPRAERERLLLLAREPNLVLTATDDGTRNASLEWLSSGNETYGTKEELNDVALYFRLNDVFWRDTVAVTSPARAITAAAFTFTVLDGMTGPVGDAIVRIRGGVTNLAVSDSMGSYFAYPATLPAGSWLRFESATGRAFVTTSDTWTGGTPVPVITGAISSLELTARYGATPAAYLSVSTDARSGTPTIEVRGRRAYTA